MRVGSDSQACILLCSSGGLLLSPLLCGQLVSLAGACAASSAAAAASSADLQHRGSPLDCRSLAGCLALAAAALHFVSAVSSSDTARTQAAGPQLPSKAWHVVVHWVETYADYLAQRCSDQDHGRTLTVRAVGPAACEAMHALLQLQALPGPATHQKGVVDAAAAASMTAGHNFMVRLGTIVCIGM